MRENITRGRNVEQLRAHLANTPKNMLGKLAVWLVAKLADAVMRPYSLSINSTPPPYVRDTREHNPKYRRQAVRRQNSNRRPLATSASKIPRYLAYSFWTSWLISRIKSPMVCTISPSRDIVGRLKACQPSTAWLYSNTRSKGATFRVVVRHSARNCVKIIDRD